MVVQLSLAWKWTVSCNFCFFIFWINHWSYRSYWFWIFNFFVFKNNFIHPFVLDCCFLASIDCTIACNFFGLEFMNERNIIFLPFIIVHICSNQLFIRIFQAIVNFKRTLIDFVDNLNNTSSGRCFAHNTMVLSPSIFQLFINRRIAN